MLELHDSETFELLYIKAEEIVAIVQLPYETGEDGERDHPPCTRVDIYNGNCYLVKEEAYDVHELVTNEISK